MRCLSCNVVLNDKEATRKYASGSFLDLCDNCFKGMEDVIPIIEGNDGEYAGEDNTDRHEQTEE